MPIVPLRNFGKYGVVADSQAQALPIGTWSDARNVRFSGLSMEKMLEPTLEMAWDSDTNGQPQWLQGWSDGLATYFAIATATKLWFWQASTSSNGEWVEAGGPYEEGQWQSFEWGDTVIFNNGNGAPQVFDQNTLSFIDLPNWGLISTADDITNNANPSKDTAARCKCIAPLKGFLVALGITESGVYQPNTVWWSDSTSLAGLSTKTGGGPPSWDYESPSTLSGKAEVGVGSGALTWGAVLNENLICYTDASATAMQVTGGRTVMSFRRLFQKGCAGLNLAAEFNNQHFVVARDQLYVHDGSTVHLIAKDRVEDEFFKRAGKGGRFNLGNADIDFEKMQVVKNPDRKEIVLLFDGEVTEAGNSGALSFTSTEWNTIYTAPRTYSGTANDPYRGTGGYGSIVQSDRNGTVMVNAEGTYRATESSDSDFSTLAVSTDFGESWTEYTLNSHVGYLNASSLIFGTIDYTPVHDRWALHASAGMTEVAVWSEDKGATWTAYSPSGTSSTGTPDVEADGYGARFGSDGNLYLSGKSYQGAFPNSKAYPGIGYYSPNDTTAAQQTVCVFGPENSYGGFTYHLVECNGRMFAFRSGTTVVEPLTYTGSALNGDANIFTLDNGHNKTASCLTGGTYFLQAWPTAASSETQLRYRKFDAATPDALTATTHYIQTSFADITHRGCDINSNGDHFLAVVSERINNNTGSTRIQAFVSEDGENWVAGAITTMPFTKHYSSTSDSHITLSYIGAGKWGIGILGTDGKHRVGTIEVSNYSAYTRQGRFGLVYNFEDNNYTWMDASVDATTSLTDVACMHYAFDPGWVVRWSDLNTDGATWDGSAGTLITATTKWSDFYSHGTEKNLYWLAEDGVYRSDQTVKTDGVKEYFVKRVGIDLDDLNASWTTNKMKHLKQFYFHAQSPTPVTGANNFDFTVGWAKTLMDSPDWEPSVTVSLQDSDNTGDYKADFRTTGRYLSVNMNFNTTAEVKMSGGDMDASESHGR